MANLRRKKVSFKRATSYNSVLNGTEISAVRNNLTGEIDIRINSNPGDGEEMYILNMTKADIDKISWLWKEKE
jgi:hypothetical protein